MTTRTLPGSENAELITLKLFTAQFSIDHGGKSKRTAVRANRHTGAYTLGSAE